MRYLVILVFLVVCIGICFSITAADEFPPWVSAGMTPVTGGYGCGIVGEGQNIFLVRCLYAASSPELYRYSATCGTWRLENTTNEPAGSFRNGTALAWDGTDSLYVLAGARYRDDTSRTLFLQYQVEESRWKMLPDTPFAQGAGNALSWCGYDSSLYAFIGSAKHNEGRSYFVRYNAVAGTWSELPYLWLSTDDGAALAWTGGEYVYALRGEYDEELPNGDFARFHIPSETWEELPSLPAVGGAGDAGSLLWIGAELTQYKGWIFALSGGTVAETPGSGFYRYNTSVDEWETLKDIPCPVGHYVGNRLAYAAGAIYYWQGSPKSSEWACKGAGFYRIPLSVNPLE